jgi:coproporphyrinogen III oxidase
LNSDELIEMRRTRIVAWITELRDRICVAFEALEDASLGPLAERAPGRFERKPWAGRGRATTAAMRAAV